MVVTKFRFNMYILSRMPSVYKEGFIEWKELSSESDMPSEYTTSWGNLPVSLFNEPLLCCICKLMRGIRKSSPINLHVEVFVFLFIIYLFTYNCSVSSCAVCTAYCFNSSTNSFILAFRGLPEHILQLGSKYLFFNFCKRFTTRVCVRAYYINTNLSN